MKCIRVILIFLMVLGVQYVYAQKKVTVVGEASCVVPGNMTMDEAKRNVLEQAKANALKSEFSEVVSQNTSTVVKVTNGQSDVRMLSQGGSSMKGEWIETIGEPEYSYIVTEKGEAVISVKVKGKAREIKGNKVDLLVKVLKYNDDGVCSESEDFKNDNKLGLYFRSPIPGYLAVYIEDVETGDVTCILPLPSSEEPSVKVEANKDYYFYSGQQGEMPLHLVASSGIDVHETIYVVFSRNSFCKANASSLNSGYNCELSHEEFFDWLWKNEDMDKEMQHEKREVVVHP